jgi:hypothetical protein
LARIDLLGLRIQPVVDKIVVVAGTVQMEAVAQMTAVVQLHRQHSVAGLEQGHIDRRVGLRAGVRLDIGKLCAEEGFGPVDGDLLGDVHKLTAAVVAPAWIALGVFVGKHTARRGQHSREDVIFAGDQFDAVVLALALQLDSVVDVRVHFLQNFAGIGLVDPGADRVILNRGKGLHTLASPG